MSCERSPLVGVRPSAVSDPRSLKKRLTPENTARMLNVTNDRLAAMRSQGLGPRTIHGIRTVMYELGEVLQYIQERSAKPISTTHGDQDNEKI